MVSAVLGLVIVVLYPDSVPWFLQSLGDLFKDLVGEIDSQTPSQLFYSLLKQNLKASLADVYLGAVFGLLPIVSIGFNFFILGFLSGAFLLPVSTSGFEGTFGEFLLAILPHGVFEIPALILSAGIGFRLGVQWLLPSSKGARKKVFVNSFKSAVLVTPLIVLLIVVAAVVEAFVTGRLVR